MTDFLEQLNDSQREAVTYCEGPALVIAGAGSGKTRVLTYKIAYLLKQGYKPWTILALTFTNKAAREMKERIATITGGAIADQLWMGTFHSIFARILRIEAERIGFSSNFTIYDAADSKNLLKAIIKEMQLDALTVAPYMGEDSVTPFLGYEGKWVILLALTSNKGSHDFQLTEDAQGERLFEKVLRKSQQWAGDDRMMYVVGATQGRMFEEIRRIVPEHFLLVPGIGAQGGSLEEVCRYGMNKTCGLIVNSSRAIIYADSTENFAAVAAEKAREVQQQMAAQLQNL